ncbi:MAG: efflux RND transporter periplasmic adaptor subunit [Firmicutes bacterium]|nr:efflux RND transporter periplasmic adaptor subunit [Bacillota bacterium]
MKKFFIALFLIFLVFIFASCGKQEKAVPEISTGSSTAGSELAGIKTAVARFAAIRRTVKMTGQVSVTENGKADITAPINGIIMESFVKVGMIVTKGEPIAVINSIYGQTSLQILQRIESDEVALSQAKDNLTQAKAELKNSEIKLRREKMLFKGGVAARSDLEDARERYDKAKAVVKDTETLLKIAGTMLQRDQAIFNQTQLSGTKLPQNLTPVPLKSSKFNRLNAGRAVLFYINAPITGTVTAYNMSNGLSVSPGTVLATVINTDQVYVDANAYESDLPFINPGDSVSAESASFPQKKFQGKVSYIGKQVDPATRTVTVRSLIQNPDGILRSGMFITVNLSASRPEKALLVPENAVLIHGEKRYIFVEKSHGNYEKRDVTVGISSAGKAEILRGLTEGEKVVTEGNLLLEGQE